MGIKGPYSEEILIPELIVPSYSETAALKQALRIDLPPGFSMRMPSMQAQKCFYRIKNNCIIEISMSPQNQKAV